MFFQSTKKKRKATNTLSLIRVKISFRYQFLTSNNKIHITYITSIKGNIMLCKMENNLVLFPIKIKLFAVYKQSCDSNIFNDFSHSVLSKVLSSIGRIANSVLRNLLNSSYRFKVTSAN